jgi:hypothetical protein
MVETRSFLARSSFTTLGQASCSAGIRTRDYATGFELGRAMSGACAADEPLER